MAETCKDIRKWLEANFNPDDLVWIDEGGLTLEGISSRMSDPQRAWYEIGGEPEEDEDE